MTTFGPKDADAWYERNKHKLPQDGDVIDNDPITDAIFSVDGIKKTGRIFEFGCANGWRLRRFIKHFKSDCWGSELSPMAIKDADPRIKMNLEPAIASCDLVIMGFCMYLLQPSSLLYWAYYADSILADGGHIIIHDFLPEYPYSRIFEHNTDLRSRKCDHTKLWLSHPAYSLALQKTFGDGDDRTHVSILRKDLKGAFPLMER